MIAPNTAQQLLISLGVDSTVVLMGHYRETQKSYTKKGPGRKHQQGKPRKGGE